MTEDDLSATYANPLRRRVGANIRAYRRARGYTLDQLATICADDFGWPLKPDQVMRIEQGKRGAEAGDLVNLALALQCTIPDLLGQTVGENLQLSINTASGHTVARTLYYALIGNTP